MAGWKEGTAGATGAGPRRVGRPGRRGSSAVRRSCKVHGGQATCSSERHSRRNASLAAHRSHPAQLT